MTSGDLNDLFKDPLSKYCLSLRCWGEDVAVRFWGTHNTTCQKLSDVNPAFSLNSKHQGRRTSHSGSSLSSPPTVHIQNKTKGTRFHRHVPPSNTPHGTSPGRLCTQRGAGTAADAQVPACRADGRGGAEGLRPGRGGCLGCLEEEQMDTQRPERHCDLSGVPGEGFLGPTFPEVFSLLSFHGGSTSLGPAGV